MLFGAEPGSREIVVVPAVKPAVVMLRRTWVTESAVVFAENTVVRMESNASEVATFASTLLPTLVSPVTLILVTTLLGTALMAFELDGARQHESTTSVSKPSGFPEVAGSGVA